MVTKSPAGIPSYLVDRAETVIKSATAAFNDAEQIQLALETLEAYERYKRDIFKKTETDGTLFVLDCIWRSLWWHLLILVGRAYAPKRGKDDLHARVAFELLSDPATRHAVVTRAKGNDSVLDEAITRWAKYEADTKVSSVIKVRNKQIAHWADLSFTDWPIKNDTLAVSRMTAEVLEKMAYGVGVATPHVVDYRDQAERFWTTFAS